MVMARQVRSLYYYTRPKGPPVAYGHHLVAYRAAHGIRLAAWFPAALVAAFVWLVHCVATRSPAWLRPEAWCEVLGERKLVGRRGALDRGRRVLHHVYHFGWRHAAGRERRDGSRDGRRSRRCCFVGGCCFSSAVL